MVERWIERRASQIPDPVERLRFLRREMRPREPFRISPRALAGLGLVLMISAGPSRESNYFVEAKPSRLSASSSTAQSSIPRVWIVEHSPTSELYSNGLRVDLTFAVPNRPRISYPIFPLATGPVRRGTKPAGIVFHTTESHLAPFEEDENRTLRQLGRNLVSIIREERSYHYVIDRFGQVFRVVDESQAANHAGNSVWGDSEGIYVNLNDSFLGIALEAQTGALDAVTPAQISAAKVLTEMLRSRYQIPAEDCVTHAQVSVNPLNMRIGSHTDWASNFPFEKLGLPNNYSIPLASLYAFGFEFDGVFLQATGARWKGLDLAMAELEQKAGEEGVPLARYRAALRSRYRDITGALRDENQGGM